MLMLMFAAADDAAAAADLSMPLRCLRRLFLSAAMICCFTLHMLLLIHTLLFHFAIHFDAMMPIISFSLRFATLPLRRHTPHARHTYAITP